MKYEWNEIKSKSNFKKHGIKFEEAIEIFKHPVLTVTDNRQDYGEVRECSIGMLEIDTVMVVIHTDRHGVTRIISARKANQKERQMYHDYIKATLARN